MTIDPGVVTLIQTKFLQHINIAFDTVSQYALNLLYLFAILELVFFGLIWALQQSAGWDRLFIKVLKIGLIFLIIQNFAYLLDTIVNSFAQIAGITVKNSKVAQFIFNPAKIWQYGYNAGLYLLQQAATSSNFGLTLIQTSLGMGILLAFGLLGIQIIIQVVGFYMIGLVALILLPFGTFDPSIKMFDKSIQSVLQAGVRVMVLILIIGIAVSVWDDFNLSEMATATVSISQPLGLFFSALLFLGMAIYLPKVAANTVGSFTSGGFFERSNIPESINITSTPPINAPTMSEFSNMAAATTIDANIPMSAGMGTNGTANASMISPNQSAQIKVAGGATLSESTRRQKDALTNASNLSKSLSTETINKLREVLGK